MRKGANQLGWGKKGRKCTEGKEGRVQDGGKEGRSLDGGKKGRKEVGWGKYEWKEEKEGSFIALLWILVNVDSFAVSGHLEKTANWLLLVPLKRKDKKVNVIHVHALPLPPILRSTPYWMALSLASAFNQKSQRMACVISLAQRLRKRKDVTKHDLPGRGNVLRDFGLLLPSNLPLQIQRCCSARCGSPQLWLGGGFFLCFALMRFDFKVDAEGREPCWTHVAPNTVWFRLRPFSGHDQQHTQKKESVELQKTAYLAFCSSLELVGMGMWPLSFGKELGPFHKGNFCSIWNGLIK